MCTDQDVSDLDQTEYQPLVLNYTLGGHRLAGRTTYLEKIGLKISVNGI